MDTTDLLEKIKELIISSNITVQKEWLSLKEGAAYAGVSYGTFIRFRIKGLKIVEVEGIKRVSRKEIDTFLENHSF
ncbi:DNA-binding protein [Solibacillus sp. A46]|uniref:DNA-binding protein n=1 Tax=Solibacillus faecavium TaxID=2762221 RepID=A0ABR8XXE3_9BACL|nr:DNA-binding protein [Solibacillus faecavium]MBD8036619.1 DNA-binding protein [Solibacillus faecavium]